ncbi:hypothetical protein GW17_00033880 [Ensete ventricosum]|nr:hypothetical protein GW17_00033880 [Ensete ventricosum]
MAACISVVQDIRKMKPLSSYQLRTHEMPPEKTVRPSVRNESHSYQPRRLPVSEQAADEKRCGREVLHGDESLSLVAKDDLPVSSWRCWWLHEGFRSSMGVTGQSPWLIRGTLVPHAGPLSLPRLQDFGRILKNSLGWMDGTSGFDSGSRLLERWSSSREEVFQLGPIVDSCKKAGSDRFPT